MVQWSRYQDSRLTVPVTARRYNLNDYVCYVCGVKTYRKRIRALRVVVRMIYYYFSTGPYAPLLLL